MTTEGRKDVLKFGGRIVARYVLLLGCAAVPAYVAAETTVGANVSAEGGYSTNPYSTGAGSAGTATATIRFSPIVTVREERSTIKLGANVSHVEYSRRYKGKTDYGGSARLETVLGARTSAQLTASADSAVIDNNSGIFSPIFDQNDPTVPVILDPSSGNTPRARRSSYRLGLGVQQRLSEADNLSLSGSASAVRTSRDPNARDYNFGSASVGYDKTLSDAVTVGVNVGVNTTDYRKLREGDSRTISPMVTASFRLGGGWRLSASGGASFTRQKQVVGTQNYSNASGSASLCNANERWNTCLSVSRAVLPSSTNSVGKQTSAGLTTSYRLTERSQLSGGISYSRSERLNPKTTEDYVHANVGYSRSLNERMSLTASAGYSDTYRSVVARRPNYEGRIGVSYALGDMK